MQLYNCKVRLGGNVNNEVRKQDVTAAEIVILREVHGADAVADIEKTRMDRRTNEDERARLDNRYASAEKLNAESHRVRIEMMRALFGYSTMPLPTKLPADDDIPEETKITRTVVKKASEEAFA